MPLPRRILRILEALGVPIDLTKTENQRIVGTDGKTYIFKGVIPVTLFDPTTGKINKAITATAGTEYTEGDSPGAGTIAGGAILAEDNAGNMHVLQLDANKLLKVSVDADTVGIGGGVQYTEADTDASITGTAILWEDASDTLVPVNTTKRLPVDANLTNPLPVDASGVAVPVTDNGAALTVDGAVTVSGTATVTQAGTVTANSTLQTGDNVVGRFKLSDGTEIALVNANGRLEVAVEESTTISTNATLQTGTNEIGNVKNSGTFAVQAASTLQAGSALAGKINTENRAASLLLSTNFTWSGASSTQYSAFQSEAKYDAIAVLGKPNTTWTTSPTSSLACWLEYSDDSGTTYYHWGDRALGVYYYTYLRHGNYNSYNLMYVRRSTSGINWAHVVSPHIGWRFAILAPGAPDGQYDVKLYGVDYRGS